MPDLNLIDLGYSLWSGDPQTVQGMLGLECDVTQPLVLVRLANRASAITLNNQPDSFNNGVHVSHLTTILS